MNIDKELALSFIREYQSDCDPDLVTDRFQFAIWKFVETCVNEYVPRVKPETKSKPKTKPKAESKPKSKQLPKPDPEPKVKVESTPEYEITLEDLQTRLGIHAQNNGYEATIALVKGVMGDGHVKDSTKEQRQEIASML